MQRAKKKAKATGRRALLLLLLLALLAGTLALRWQQAERMDAAAPSAAAETVMTAQAPGETTAEPTTAETAAPQASPPSPEAETAPAQTPAPEQASAAGRGYTERSYALVSDLIQTYRTEQEDGAGEIAALLEQLKAEDAALGLTWERIMEYWRYVNNDLVINYDVLPDGLPRDDSLCIVVLGFQLQRDGAMAPELIARCETALACAEKYPNAFVAVTGGGTAIDNRAATEARAMEAWFLRRGLEPERLIVEDTSLTSAENALFTGRILREQYPQVRNIAVVSSDYHIRLGSLLFMAEALVTEYETGEQPYTVLSNAACAVPDFAGTEGVRKQAQYLWVVADPYY